MKELPQCHYLGSYDDSDPPEPLGLPEDWSGDPFEYLPNPYVMSPEELDLAQRYENSDVSGGYIRSQVAHFRKPKSEQRHAERKAKLESVLPAVASQNLVLPESFLKLVRTNEIIDRIRHNTIWLRLFPKLIPFPLDTTQQLFEIFNEGQGCGYWALLLAPDQSHSVVTYDESLDIESSYAGGLRPDLSTFRFQECASSFDEWLAYYFLDCRNCDRNYELLVKQFPRM